MAENRIALRPVAQADRQVWGALWGAYLDFYESTLPAETYDTAFDRLLSDDPATFQGLLAWDDDTALGLVHWVQHPHMWRPEGVVYLQDLFTIPEARGQGVARQLIEAVYASADAAGSPRVYWLTRQDNHTARQLYDRIGRLSPFLKYERA
ncbi:GNAT family N-acetyltransferase [Jannaschia sp.]|nr:GNAT family N-acetyltransferase [Jannaschia sp.]